MTTVHRDVPPGTYVPAIIRERPRPHPTTLTNLIWPKLRIAPLTAAQVLSLQSAGLIDKIAGRWIVTEAGYRANEFRSI